MNLKKVGKKIFFIIGAALILVSYQNCGQPFKVAQLNSVLGKAEQASLGELPPAPLAKGEVRLAWDSATTNEDGSSASVRGYKIYITNDDNYSRIIECVSPEHRVTGLESGETYHFSVAALTDDGSESDKSSEVSYKVR